MPPAPSTSSSTASSSRAPSAAAPTATAERARRVADEVRAHAARDALGALALDVLSRQAEGKVLFAGREHVLKRAAEHGATRESAQTGAGNLLDILERGAETDAEREIVAAFALHGFGEKLAASAPEDAPPLLARFTRHADWLALATPYDVLALADAVLPRERAARIWSELAQAIVDDATGADAGTPAARARNAARLSSLGASGSPAARDALSAVADTAAIDPPTRALALALRGDAGPEAARARVRGRLERPRRAGFVAVLRWISGWALAAWALRALGALLGVRREAEMTVGDRGVEVREERFLLGRKIGESISTVSPAAIAEAGRDVRYPSLHLLVGVVALSVGLLFGGLVVFDGARSGELTLMLIGAGLALGGAALDLALDVIGPGSRGRVSVDLAVQPGRVVRIARVPLEDADRFLGALRRARA